MFILKAYRNSSTFEQHFDNWDLYTEQASILQANGWIVGEHTRVSAFLNGVH
jgi:hypothetical protein